MYEEIFIKECSNESSIFHSLMTSQNGFKRIGSEITCFNLNERILSYDVHSTNIKLGNAIEHWTNQMVQDYGYTLLIRKAMLKNGKQGDLDFAYVNEEEKIIYFAEIKVRDDHDSTKKKAQTDDFLDKLQYLQENYPDYKVYGCFWFVDPAYDKNKNYYLSRLNKDQVLYGNEFDKFIKIEGLYNSLIDTLKNYRNIRINSERTENIDINISDYSVGKWLKFLSSVPPIINYFYPQGVPYAKLLEYAKTKPKRTECKQLIQLCEARLNGF